MRVVGDGFPHDHAEQGHDAGDAAVGGVLFELFDEHF
jgi:hypothetical protein